MNVVQGSISQSNVERTLIIVIRALTRLKTAFAGVIFENCSARLRPSMAAFIMGLRSFGCWDFVAIVDSNPCQ